MKQQTFDWGSFLFGMMFNSLALLAAIALMPIWREKKEGVTYLVSDSEAWACSGLFCFVFTCITIMCYILAKPLKNKQL